MKRFLILVVAGMVALDVFAPVVRAQDFVVNGHAATKASTAADVLQRAGRTVAGRRVWHRAGSRRASNPVVQTAGQKCWYVLDVKLCD